MEQDIIAENEHLKEAVARISGAFAEGQKRISSLEVELEALKQAHKDLLKAHESAESTLKHMDDRPKIPEEDLTLFGLVKHINQLKQDVEFLKDSCRRASDEASSVSYKVDTMAAVPWACDLFRVEPAVRL